MAFRGGTALNKLYFPTPVRYSEDLDFVQRSAGPIKDIVKSIQKTIDPWLGKSSTESRKNGFRIYYRFASENNPGGKKRIKIEMDTREHFSVFPMVDLPFSVQSQWYNGDCTITTYHLNELLGTKMRAMYQRKKGRDLFDLDWAINHCEVDKKKIVQSFLAYMDFQELSIDQKDYIVNLEEKINNPVYRQDIFNYVRPDIEYDPWTAFENVKRLVQII